MTITYTYGNNLYVNTTNRCDMNCEFCLRNSGDGVGNADSLWLEREPTKDEILEDIRKNLSGFHSQIVFCGYGEPTYRLDDILWVCDRLKSEGCTIPIRMDTNGHGDLINNKETAKLMKGRIDAVSISLNDSSATEYVERCKPCFGEASFQAMLDFTRDCMKYISSVTMTVVDDMPEDEIERCRIICENIGAKFRVRVYSPNW